MFLCTLHTLECMSCNRGGETSSKIWEHSNDLIITVKFGGTELKEKKKKPAKPWSISSFPDLKDKTDVSMLSSLESDSSRDLCLANFLTEALLSSPSSGPELAWPPLSTGLTGVDVSRLSLLSSDSRSRMRLADLLLVDRALLSSTWSMTSLLSSSLAKKKKKLKNFLFYYATIIMKTCAMLLPLSILYHYHPCKVMRPI